MPEVELLECNINKTQSHRDLHLGEQGPRTVTVMGRGQRKAGPTGEAEQTPRGWGQGTDGPGPVCRWLSVSAALTRPPSPVEQSVLL